MHQKNFPIRHFNGPCCCKHHREKPEESHDSCDSSCEATVTFSKAPEVNGENRVTHRSLCVTVVEVPHLNLSLLSSTLKCRSHVSIIQPHLSHTVSLCLSSTGRFLLLRMWRVNRRDGPRDPPAANGINLLDSPRCKWFYPTQIGSAQLSEKSQDASGLTE